MSLYYIKKSFNFNKIATKNHKKTGYLKVFEKSLQ